MTIRIRLPKTKTGAGQLSLYRSEYQPASRARSGERIPGHQKDVYVGSLPRFTPDGVAAGAIVYHDPTTGGLTGDELIVLNAFLLLDHKNYRDAWPKDLIAAVKEDLTRQAEQQRYLEQAAQSASAGGISTADVIKALRDNTARLVAQAGELVKSKKEPRKALYRSEYVPLAQAWQATKEALQAAKIVAVRPRERKKGGA